MRKTFSLLLLLMMACAGCRSYNQNIMFRTASQRLPDNLALAAAAAQKNYTIQRNDLLEIRLFSNKGEEIINDNINQNPLGTAGAAGTSSSGQAGSGIRYLVQDNGVVRVPLLGNVKLEGFTLAQADSLLEKTYNNFYAEPFVETKFVNKRVIVLGATGGHVIPLQNENMNLIEVIALAGGANNTAKVGNIRLIRGDLQQPEVYLIDLSTVEGMTRSTLQVKANDIIYIEPISRPLRESISDIAPVLGLFSSLVSVASIIVLLIQQQRGD
jgi:polysaccharide export outer membrane protein